MKMNRQNQMIEIIVDGNETGRKILINGVPELEKVPKEVLDCFAEKLLEVILDKNW